MKWKNTIFIYLSLSAALVVILAAAGCGGGVKGGVAAAGLQATWESGGKNDNPIFPLPPGHPNRIFLISNKDGKTPKIFSMNPDGTDMTIVVQKPVTGTDTMFDITTSPYNLTTPPGVTSNGFNVYFATEYFATNTILMKTSLKGSAPQIILRPSDALNAQNPRVSWDEGMIAFTKYKEYTGTVAIKPERQTVSPYIPSSSDFPNGNALLGLTPSADSMKTNAIGLAYLGLEASGPCSATATYSTTLALYAVKGRTSTPYTPMIGQTFCIKVNDTNYIKFKITDYNYGFAPDPTTSCSVKDDCGLSKTTPGPGFLPGNVYCSSSLKQCIFAKKEDAKLVIEWSWYYTGVGTNPPKYTASLTDVYDTSAQDASKHLGAGVNLIANTAYRVYDLLAMTPDSSTPINPQINNHHDDLNDPDDPANNLVFSYRYPCFSPCKTSDGAYKLYYIKDAMESMFMDSDYPYSSTIEMLTVKPDGTVSGPTKILNEAGAIYKQCSFNANGTLMAFSKYTTHTSGTTTRSDYDVYLRRTSECSDASPDIQLAVDSGGNDLYPSISPAGNQIVFQSNASPGYTNADGDWDIFVSDLSGTMLRNITNNFADDDMMPVWGP